MKNDKVPFFHVFSLKNIFFHIKAKLAFSKSFFSDSGVSFMIQCILDYAQRHLVNF